MCDSRSIAQKTKPLAVFSFTLSGILCLRRKIIGHHDLILFEKFQERNRGFHGVDDVALCLGFCE